ncbi:M1 family aminopeptidase [Caulobacter sp. S45]|uniref:ABC transporter permease/M1 family aminopeptidase n=1 Tax=Caulobacter sp. S45 TaxID=1641861 RepID=UPI0015776C33|nr:M1 family aminopeptidase [Caulobacter sp. S45]
MFAAVAGFELRYQLKSPIFWVAGLLFFLLTFGSVASDTIQLGSTANVHVNSPSAIAVTQLIFSLFFMFVSTAFVANVVVRDDDTGYGPILRATRLGKFDYLYGRFLGAFIAAALCFLFIPLAMIVGSAMPWVDAEKLGPLRLDAYAYTYVALALPTLFLVCAAFFALATATRSLMATYVGVVAFMIVYLVAVALAAKPQFRTLMAYVEPFGTAAFGNATRYWTATERNTQLVPFAGALLWNRLIWTGAGVVALAAAYALFRFEAPVGKVKKREAERRDALDSAAETGRPAPRRTAPTPPAPRCTSNAAARSQLLARTRLDMGQVFKSPAFFVLLALGVFNSGAGLWFTTTDSIYGDDIFPVARVLIQVLRGSFTFIPLVVAIYYAGELVWRERDRNTDVLVDATPTPDWVFAAPKIVAIIGVLFAMLAVSILAAIVVQLIRGFPHFELGKYVGWYLLPETVNVALIAVLAVFLQTLSPHKFVGWGLMVVFIISTIVLPKMGFEHNLYIYGGSPDVPLSDMNDQGMAGLARTWFLTYWSLIALGLCVLSAALWRRGADASLRPRLRRLPRRLAGPAGVVLAISLLGAVSVGGFIYLNTNVWNPYRTALGDERFLADYEKALLPYETVAQPKVTDVKLMVDLYPDGPYAISRGVYVFQNKTSAPIRTLHVRFERDLTVQALSVEGARPLRTYDRFNYRIFAFDTPLLPGEKRSLSFTARRSQHGFRNGGNTTRIVRNGSFLDSFEVAPIIGMDRAMLLKDRAKRRKYHLSPDLRPPKLEDDGARRFNGITHGADWVNSDITVSTVADQTPMAPGYRIADRVANGRHVAEFRTEAPILDFFSIQSARYAVKTVPYKGVDLSVYYDPQHPWNVDRMIKALEVGLDYDQANFSPYQFRQMRILEFPDYAQFAQSFANTIPYSEGIGFLVDTRDKAKIDMVTYVTAHELGHQWWAHQVIAADMQGGSMLVETFAQYSALMAMKHLYGPDQIRKFLKFELDSYLRSRGAEAVEELPLERVEDQGYIHYRKGSLVMYRLQDEVGEAAVNRALRRLIHTYAFKGAPYPASKDFIADLRAEVGPDKQQLITDLFEKITLYDLRAVHASSNKRIDGRYDVTLQVSAKKLYANGQGKEAEAPLNEPFDIALFAREPGKADFGPKDVILFKHLAVHSGKQSFTFTVDRLPKFAGVDPYNKAIDRNSDDNTIPVS